MSISDLEAAELCDRLYNDPTFAWDLRRTEDSPGGVSLGVKQYPWGSVVMCEGTIDAKEWIENDLDSEFFRHVPDFATIGNIPFGFSLGLGDAFEQVKRYADAGPLFFAGHSLGAAHASELCGMFVSSGEKVLGLTTWGSPRPGMTTLRDLIVGAGVPIHLKRNIWEDKVDRVTTVPTDPPDCHLVSFIDTRIEPVPNDPWALFGLELHHFQLYVIAEGGKPLVPLS